MNKRERTTALTELGVIDPVYGPGDLTPNRDTLSNEEAESLYDELKKLVEKYGEIAVSFELAEVRANRGMR